MGRLLSMMGLSSGGEIGKFLARLEPIEEKNSFMWFAVSDSDIISWLLSVSSNLFGSD